MDAFCTWNALVFGNYEAGMAVPIKRKLGLSMAYQPAFTQKLIWIGQMPDDEGLELISDLIRSHYGDLRINTELNLAGLNQRSRTNLILDLNKDYESLTAAYSKDLRKNLRKVEVQGLQLVEESNAQNAISLYRQAYGSLNPHLQDSDYERFNHYIEKIIPLNRALAYSVESSQSDQPLASIVLLSSHGRLHYVLGAPSTEGRKLNGLSYAIDQVIKQNALSPTILDFEGSSIESVARYYRSFGAIAEEFFEYRSSPNLVMRMLRKFQSQ